MHMYVPGAGEKREEKEVTHLHSHTHITDYTSHRLHRV